MTKPTLRRTLLAPILIATALGFAVLAIFIDRVEQINRIDDVDAELVRANAAQAIDPGVRPIGEDDENRGLAIEIDTTIPVQLVLDGDGTVIAVGRTPNPFSAATLSRLASASGFSTIEDGDYRVLVRRDDPTQISVTALSLELTNQSASEFRQILATGAIVILAVVAAIAWIVIGSFTRPIIELASAATRIADGDLETELSVPTSSQELDQLTHDLDRMLDRIRSTIQDAEQSAADASRARDDMGRFLADMAHELRTPLTALKGYSDLYAGGMLADTADVDRAMSRIGSESERLYRLVDQMLSLARTGNAVAAREQVDVGAIAGVVVADLQAARSDCQIEFRGVDGSFVDGVAEQLHQAILNLGANGCHHGGSFGEVLVEVDSDDRSIFVRVIDHGPGVDQRDRERIFLPFFRLDESRVRDGDGGAGLGLTLTKQIITQHNGTIEIDDTPGGGATFIVTIPRVHGAEPQRQIAAS